MVSWCHSFIVSLLCVFFYFFSSYFFVFLLFSFLVSYSFCCFLKLHLSGNLPIRRFLPIGIFLPSKLFILFFFYLQYCFDRSMNKKLRKKKEEKQKNRRKKKAEKYTQKLRRKTVWSTKVQWLCHIKCIWWSFLHMQNSSINKPLN